MTMPAHAPAYKPGVNLADKDLRLRSWRPDAKMRRELEWILRDLQNVQNRMQYDSDAEGYIGEAVCAIALALGRHAP
jgi:hypothetical protein